MNCRRELDCAPVFELSVLPAFWYTAVMFVLHDFCTLLGLDFLSSFWYAAAPAMNFVSWGYCFCSFRVRAFMMFLECISGSVFQCKSMGWYDNLSFDTTILALSEHEALTDWALKSNVDVSSCAMNCLCELWESYFSSCAELGWCVSPRSLLTTSETKWTRGYKTGLGRRRVCSCLCHRVEAAQLTSLELTLFFQCVPDLTDSLEHTPFGRPMCFPIRLCEVQLQPFFWMLL